MPPITLKHLAKLKKTGEKFAALTVYDASFAQLASQAGTELLLVGDSLGMVIQGHSTTVPVTMEEMLYHTRSVARGNTGGALLMSDLPFMSYATLDSALKNATALMQAGAQLIKLEGGAWLAETIRQLSERGIPVCAHLGLTPQSVHKLGGFRIQGRQPQEAEQLQKDAQLLQEAGAQLLVLECIPATLAATVTNALTIPTLGIGASRHCDGQILVSYDILGISSGYHLTFCKNFMAASKEQTIESAIKGYIHEVKTIQFPHVEHEFN